MVPPARFHTDDGANTWRAITRGLRSNFKPDPTAETSPYGAAPWNTTADHLPAVLSVEVQTLA